MSNKKYNECRMVTKGEVWWTLQFPALHCWPGAQAPVEFLRHPHRHMFKIKCTAPVDHNDRDIEFLTIKAQMQKFCDERYAGRDLGRMSCEDIATELLEQFEDVRVVEVSEDGENGATIHRVGWNMQRMQGI